MSIGCKIAYMTPGKKIENLRKGKKLTQVKLGKLVGVSGVAIGYWERDENIPKGENLVALAKVFGVSPSYIVEDGNVNAVREPAQALNYSTPTDTPLARALPLLSANETPLWLAPDFDEKPITVSCWQATTAILGRKAFAIRAQGRSMHNPNGAPSIPEGSIVIIDPDSQPEHGKIVLAKTSASGELTIKMLAIDGATRYLQPLNPDFKPMQIDSGCEILGVIKQIVQDV